MPYIRQCLFVLYLSCALAFHADLSEIFKVLQPKDFRIKSSDTGELNIKEISKKDNNHIAPSEDDQSFHESEKVIFDSSNEKPSYVHNGDLFTAEIAAAIHSADSKSMRKKIKEYSKVNLRGDTASFQATSISYMKLTYFIDGACNVLENQLIMGLDTCYAFYAPAAGGSNLGASFYSNLNGTDTEYFLGLYADPSACTAPPIAHVEIGNFPTDGTCFELPTGGSATGVIHTLSPPPTVSTPPVVGDGVLET